MADGDFIRLTGGPYPANAIPMPKDMGWPPPDRLAVAGLMGRPRAIGDAAQIFADRPELEGRVVVYRQIRRSQLDDSHTVGGVNLARGAEYELEVDPFSGEVS